jgi:hypothetical protein
MVRLLLTILAISAAPSAYAVVQCPTTLVVVSCKGQPSGAPDQNGFVTNEWVTKNAMLVCRREEVALADGAEMQGAAPPDANFSNNEQCARIAMMIAPNYENAHKGWFVLTVGCPTPIINVRPDGSEEIIGYQMPQCPSWVKCEVDSTI